ncbi:MAG: hypothetical protein WCR67_04235 [Bacilli bacterium]
MDYSYELFLTDKGADGSTRYSNVMYGAFYNVYTNGNGDYHMAKEAKASLLERMRFLPFCIRDESYPIFDAKLGITSLASSNLLELTRQVLGLPIEMLYRIDSHTQKAVILTSEEIINSISFEDGLFLGYGELEFGSDEILHQTNYGIIGLINYIISNGFYFPNPERVSVDTGLEMVFPVFVDENQIPEKYHKPANSHDLLISYVKNPLFITREVFLNFFRTIDQMSISDQIDYAYNQISESDPTEIAEVKLALRNYYNGIIREIINEFFLKYYQHPNVMASGLFNKDFGLIDTTFRFIAVGRRFNMIGRDFRHFEKKGETVLQIMKPNYYVLSSADVPALKNAYKSVRKFFLNHPDYCFLPSLYIRMMGLPYEAFKICEFFDFQRGTFEQFIDLFILMDDMNLKVFGIITPLVTPTGIYSTQDDEGPLYDAKRYIDSLGDKGFFVSSQECYFQKGMNWFIDYDENHLPKSLKPFIEGDIKAYKEAIDDMFFVGTPSESSSQTVSKLKMFIQKNQSFSSIIPVQKILALMHEKCLTLIEAAKELGYTDKQTLISCNSLIANCLLYSLDNEIERTKRKEESNLETKRFGGLLQDDIFVDKYLKMPMVFKGRYFMAYGTSLTGDIYFDSKDSQALTNLHKIFRTDFLKRGEFPYSFTMLGQEKIYRQHFNPMDSLLIEAIFMGLPLTVISALDLKKSILSQLKFVDNLALDSRPDHFALVRDDLSFSFYSVFSRAASQGIFYFGRGDSKNTCCFQKGGLNERILYFLSPDYIKNYLISLSNRSLVDKKIIPAFFSPDSYRAAIKAFVMANDEDFRMNFILRISDNLKTYSIMNNSPKLPKPSDIDSWLVFEYSNKVRKASYQAFYDEIFSTRSASYLLFYHLGNYFVSPGQNFFAFSTSGNLDDFFLEQKDFEAVKFAFSSAYVFYSHIKNSRMRAKYMTNSMGLPPVFIKKVYRQLLTGLPTDSDLCRIFRFSQIPNLKQSSLLGYIDDFTVETDTMNKANDSTFVHHESLKQGMYIAADVNLLWDSLADMKALATDLKASFSKINKLKVFCSKNLIGDCRNTLKPWPTCFASQVDCFINLIKPYCLDVSYLFYLKEYLIYFNRTIPDFMVDSINMLHQEKETIFLNYFKKLISKTKISAMKNSSTPEWFAYGIALFLFVQEQQCVYYIHKNRK